MLLLVLVLVLIAFGLLVVALLTGTALWAWVSVGVSVLAAFVLLVDWLQRRSAVRRAEEQQVGQVAAAAAPSWSGFDADPVTEQLPVVRQDPPPAPDPVGLAETAVVLPAAEPPGSPQQPSGAPSRAPESQTVVETAGAPSAESPPPVEPPARQAPPVDHAPAPVPVTPVAESATAVTEPAAPVADPAAAADDDAGPPTQAQLTQAAIATLGRPPEPPAQPPAEPASAVTQGAADSRADADREPVTAAIATPPASAATAEPVGAAEVPAGAAEVPAGAAEVTAQTEAAPSAASAPEQTVVVPTTVTAAEQSTPADADPAAAAPAAEPAVEPTTEATALFERPDTVDDQTMALPVSADAEPPEDPRDSGNAALVAGLTEVVVVIDERPRYHVSGCRFLPGKTEIPLPVKEAVELGFTPCGWCNPDRTLSNKHRATSTR